jgi:hypothetical protein
VILVLLASLGAALPGGQLAQRFQGGFAVAAVKDKSPRVVLSFREFNGEPGHLIGYSLESGGYFFDWNAPTDRINYGRRLGAIGDLDGDGFEDLAVGCSVDRRPKEPPLVELHSGRTGELFGTLEPEIDEPGFGECLAALPDVDGDGRGDFLVGASLQSPLRKGTFAGYAIYSGRTRERLGRVVSETVSGLMQGALVLLPGPKDHPWAAHATGRSVLRMDLASKVVEQAFTLEGELAAGQVSGIASAGDLDGDGCEELLLAINLGGQHRWLQLEGKSWKPRALPATAALPGGALAWLTRAGDLDGDGADDFLGERSCSQDDLLYAFSGKTLACVRKLPVPSGLAPYFGGACAWLPGGGKPNYVCAANCAPMGSAGKRGVYVFDWSKGTLVHPLGQR